MGQAHATAAMGRVSSPMRGIGMSSINSRAVRGHRVRLSMLGRRLRHRGGNAREENTYSPEQGMTNLGHY